MSELVDWLSAQLDADEAAARAAMTDDRWKSRRDDLPELHSYGDFGWTVRGVWVETEDSDLGKAQADHIARHDPARVLVEVEAKRAIVALGVGPLWDAAEMLERDGEAWESVEGGPFDGPGFLIRDQYVQHNRTLRLLASVFADRPGFDETWRP